MKNTRSLIVQLCFVVALSVLARQSLAITGLRVFGDSLTDIGNVFQISGTAGTPVPLSPPYFDGRFSNGPAWVEYLAQPLGLAPLTHSLAGGTNYAWGGAETGTGTSTRNTPNISEQVTGYLNSVGGSADPNELFIIWGGANDFANAGQTDPTIPAANVAGDVARLANAGATHFLIPNMPPLGLTPVAITNGVQGPLNALAAGYNTALSAELDTLESTLGVMIHRLDVFELFNETFADAASAGLTNLTDPAYTGFVETPGTVVAADPDEYAFWDVIHPSATVHGIIGNAAVLTVIPEPTTAAVLGFIGVCALSVRTRRV